MSLSISFLTLLHGLQCVIWACVFYFNPAIDNLYNFNEALYFSLVTFTTVGYGDISPVTGLGQFLASVVMIIGYGVIAVPTSIITMEMNKASRTKEDIPTNTQRCRNCGDDYHLDGAIYCKTCGHLLNEP